MSLFDLDSNITEVASDLAGFDDELNHTKEALERVVRKVCIPAFSENFFSGGRPPWPPTEDGGTPLIKTGRLYSGSQAFSGWSISDTEAEFREAAGAPYGIHHQFGTSKMPQRMWASLTPEDEEKAEEEIVEWIAEKLGEHGFSTFTASFGGDDF